MTSKQISSSCDLSILELRKMYWSYEYYALKTSDVIDENWPLISWQFIKDEIPQVETISLSMTS